jgi:hypothetical protein
MPTAAVGGRGLARASAVLLILGCGKSGLGKIG